MNFRFDENGNPTLGQPLSGEQRLINGVLLGGRAKFNIFQKIKPINNGYKPVLKGIEKTFEYTGSSYDTINSDWRSINSNQNSGEE